ncbi:MULTISPECIES: 1,4-dihydroxy-2-naphthoate polyprenyltransferase [Kosakonia]|jgi:1,4-dihydroxy-2-naphthoate octaprenyltransferase|uniref:1,4-dihydroxy-2-naphthoate octaprenyltransferase n=2 Tax=Enterobacteriaceae TaxID=543 RepID=A0A807LE10_9ENTR|nr:MULTISPECIES: 1,4-dihydroxy-2-naphthoate polyprenyltransferase [Kosakonia]ESS59072.1 1,4-dihydroxy-2-naphthoate octaprenyltransferase [Enterobacter cloacae S611]MDP9770863.1 1,4-dihydroxy-2-naphthoate octaprenyltransferase [Atlantibacter hermannii]APZ03752.1 1,4-dihydroxy-2-naphthoate polyprenyltransferase [Kosakonia cowanii JCM 10956 = DSM 18146]MDM9617893.1 1,4-dihydroxy-2-naphthoate polyprenyltransferase [Kosakonia cowanii]MDP4562924.1 1,4-dihydroxy-2-naphthoate polyprenyltransferase [Ko
MNDTHSLSLTQAWLESLRPKTLPLAFAAIVVGTVLAWWQGYFDPLVAALALITAGLLQILSNLANDYGDAIKGSDKPDRIGPLRGMQKGAISLGQMKRALLIVIVLSCVSGLWLVSAATQTMADFVGFLALGGLSIIAAITYTVGKRPYGYQGLGDISVLTFFGWISVMGSWYLQAHTLIPAIFLPATACGLLATAVLNINNLRDIDSDRENGKHTLVVRLGPVNARRYHAGLLAGALLCFALFNLISLHSLWGWLFLLAAPLLFKQARYVLRERDPRAMPPMLERTVKGALLTNLLFVLGIILSKTLA